jgi:FKBP-type peptidyl-prolyl cis-trans isomerase
MSIVQEYDLRDFSQGGILKEIIDEQEQILLNDLRVYINKEGEGDPIPNGATVWVHYVGKLSNG